MTRIAIIGAGVIGVSTAYSLAKRGYDVAVIEQASGPAMETSFANGGQLSFCHSEPWATPELLRKLPGWLFRRDAPVQFHPSLDPQLWRWSWQFMRQCNAKQVERTSHALLAMGQASKRALGEILAETGMVFDHAKNGTLHLCRTSEELAYSEALAEIKAESGCRYIVLDHAALVAQEPALGKSRVPLAGAIYYPDDESGDVHRFTQALTEICERHLAVKFYFGRTVTGWGNHHGRLNHCMTDKGAIRADQFIVCAGHRSNRILSELGIRLPLYPMRGFSLTFHAPDEKDGVMMWPNHALTDSEQKLVYSRLGGRIRVAGLADLGTPGIRGQWSETQIKQRCEQVQKQAMRLIPGLERATLLERWSGLRPATPSGLPIVDKTHVENLWLNTGHGTLGWTMAAGSAEAIARQMEQHIAPARHYHAVPRAA